MPEFGKPENPFTEIQPYGSDNTPEMKNALTRASAQREAGVQGQDTHKSLDEQIPDLYSNKSYIKGQQEIAMLQARNLHVVDKILTESHAGKTATDIASELKKAGNIKMDEADLRSLIRTVRGVKGIPSLDDKTAFDEWQKTFEQKLNIL